MINGVYECFPTKSEPKLAEIFAIMCINIRQAQIEFSMNVNMAGQTILAKLPRQIESTSSLDPISWADTNEHKRYFKGVFDMV